MKAGQREKIFASCGQGNLKNPSRRGERYYRRHPTRKERNKEKAGVRQSKVLSRLRTRRGEITDTIGVFKDPHRENGERKLIKISLDLGPLMMGINWGGGGV